MGIFIQPSLDGRLLGNWSLASLYLVIGFWHFNPPTDQHGSQDVYGRRGGPPAAWFWMAVWVDRTSGTGWVDFRRVLYLLIWHCPAFWSSFHRTW
jgi:hypothetical protein